MTWHPGGMSCLPRGSGELRAEWSSQHQWLAGCYFGVLLAIPFAMMSLAAGPSAASAGLLGLAIWISAGLLFALSINGRWGRHFERPDASSQPLPSGRRMWSRTSDRFLWWMRLLGLLSSVASTGELLAGGTDILNGLFGLAASVWLVATSWNELHRRR